MGSSKDFVTSRPNRASFVARNVKRATKHYILATLLLCLWAMVSTNSLTQFLNASHSLGLFCVVAGALYPAFHCWSPPILFYSPLATKLDPTTWG